MRKVTKEICAAFIAREKKTVGNSHTFMGALWLHGNKIAEIINGELWITNAGWQSNTTKERLNGLPNVSICQRQGQWFLNGKLLNGELIKVCEL